MVSYIKLKNLDIQNVIYNSLENNVKKNKKELINSFKNISDFYFLKNENLEFSSSFLRDAYLLRFSTLFSNITFYHFDKIILDRKLDYISLCSLGGGPGTDALGIVMAAKKHSIKKIKIVIIDIDKNWYNSIINIFKDIEVKFIVKDLYKPLDDETKRILENSNIVTMSYLISAMDKRKESKTTENFLTSVQNTIKFNTILMYLDSANKIHWNHIEKCINLEFIVHPLVEYLCLLDIELIKKHYEFVNSNLKITSSTFAAFCVWIKTGIKSKYLDYERDSKYLTTVKNKHDSEIKSLLTHLKYF